KLEEQEMKDIDKNENLDFSIINVNSKEGKALLDNFNMKFDYLSSIMKTTCKQQMVSNKQLELTYEMVKNIREEFNEFKKYNSKDALQELIIKYEELKINIDHDVKELKDSLCPEETVEKCKIFFNKRANFKEFL